MTDDLFSQEIPLLEYFHNGVVSYGFVIHMGYGVMQVGVKFIPGLADGHHAQFRQSVLELLIDQLQALLIFFRRAVLRYNGVFEAVRDRKDGRDRVGGCSSRFSFRMLPRRNRCGSSFLLTQSVPEKEPVIPYP